MEKEIDLPKYLKRDLMELENSGCGAEIFAVDKPDEGGFELKVEYPYDFYMKTFGNSPDPRKGKRPIFHLK